MNHTVAARLALAFLQMAEDEWVLFCRMELARPMGYEKVMVREGMKLIKHRLRNKCREMRLFLLFSDHDKRYC